MSNAAALLFRGSDGELRARIKNEQDGTQVIDSVTVTAKLTKPSSSTPLFTGRTMTYSATKKLHRNDDETGAWFAAVEDTELTTTEQYEATIDIVGATTHQVVLPVPVVIDRGQ